MYERHCWRYWYCSIYFLLGHKIEHYHCHELWFACCTTCNLNFSSPKLENGLKKHIWNVTRIKYGFVELVVRRFVSDSLPHGHIGFIVSLKLCRNLCSFNYSLNLVHFVHLVSNFKPLKSWIAKTEIPVGLIKLRILDLNVFIKSMFLSSSLRFPHSIAQCWKKNYSKTLVLRERFLLIFELKIELNIFLHYHMEWGSFDGKIVANPRIFCERR